MSTTGVIEAYQTFTSSTKIKYSLTIHSSTLHIIVKWPSSCFKLKHKIHLGLILLGDNYGILINKGIYYTLGII